MLQQGGDSFLLYLQHILCVCRAIYHRHQIDWAHSLYVRMDKDRHKYQLVSYLHGKVHVRRTHFGILRTARLDVHHSGSAEAGQVGQGEEGRREWQRQGFFSEEYMATGCIDGLEHQIIKRDRPKDDIK